MTPYIIIAVLYGLGCCMAHAVAEDDAQIRGIRMVVWTAAWPIIMSLVVVMTTIDWLRDY